MANVIKRSKGCGKVFASIQLEALKFWSVANNFINKAMKMEALTKKGFTLVELLVVISVIGMLSTIAVVSLGTARQKARDTTRIATMKQVATGLEQFYADTGGYPAEVATTAAYAIGGHVLCNATTRASGTDFDNSTCTGTAYTTVSVDPTPLPTSSVACPTAATFPFAAAVYNNYCYGDDKAYASGVYGTTYQILWSIENSANNPLTGSKCITSPSGTICT